ncbi:MAG TPA: Na+/H+ antiporter subunit G [Spirochaetia bacterium]|nr:MAG: Na+/H+ antiporter subunit G [Spirochaetes bacterium GWB1_36_13]HCL58182.1 Na+/H+ antiporter subunit G [Spirochaetia bacterium]
MLEVIGTFFIILGSLFLFLGALGLYRMPDVFNKLQAGTKATTLGFLSAALGALLVKPEWTFKIILIAAILLLTNPLGSHALARAAKKSGLFELGEEQKGGEK